VTGKKIAVPNLLDSEVCGYVLCDLFDDDNNNNNNNNNNNRHRLSLHYCDNTIGRYFFCMNVILLIVFGLASFENDSVYDID